MNENSFRRIELIQYSGIAAHKTIARIRLQPIATNNKVESMGLSYFQVKFRFLKISQLFF